MKRWLAILVAVMSSLVLVAAVLGSGMGHEGASDAIEVPSDLIQVNPQFEVVNQIGGQIGDVEQSGDFMFMAVGSRLTIWDVSEPSQPVRLKQTAVFESGPVDHITIVNDYAYLVAGSKFLILDISVPTEPVEVGSYTAPGWINGLAIFGNHAYIITGGTDITIVDITNAAEPQEVGIFTINVNWELWDLQIWENYLMVTGFDDSDTPYWTGRVAGLNLSNPISPTVEAEMQFASPPGVMIHNGYAYWYHDDDRHNFDPNLFTVEIGVWGGRDYDLPDSGWPAAGAGNRLYMYGGWCENLCVLDVTDPLNITVIGDYPWPGSYLVPIDEYLYSLDASGLHIVETVGITEVGFLPLDVQYFGSVEVTGEYLIVVGCLFRMFQPAFPQRVTCLEGVTGSITDVKIQGNYAYVSAANGVHGLYVIDLTQPGSPTIVSALNFPNSILSFEIAGDYVYAVSRNAFNGFVVIDISEPTMPTVKGMYQMTLDPFDLIVVGNYVYVTNPYNGLHILDVTNPNLPIQVGQLFLDSWPGAIVKRGDYAYIGGYSPDGLYVIDIANPATPFELAFFPTGYNSVNGITLSGQYALLKMAYFGSIIVVDISKPTNPIAAGGIDTPGTVEDIAVAGHYLYVADGANGLYILWQATPAVTTITAAGGSLNSAEDGTWYVFPAGTFSETVTVTHTARYGGNLPGTGALVGIEHFFEVTGVYSGTGGTAEPRQPYALTIHYTEAERGAAIEETLGLYYWDGGAWVREESSVVDPANNLIIAAPDHFGIWVVLGETERTFMPLGPRD
jgi:hypothetical protein